MKRTFAALGAGLLLGVAPAAADPWLGHSWPAERHRPPEFRVAQVRSVLPAHEIVTIIRSDGFEPLGRPVRRGPVYEVQAIDDFDTRVRVVVDARTGYIVAVRPVVIRLRGAAFYPPRRVWGPPYEEVDPPLPPALVPGQRVDPPVRSAAIAPVTPPVPRPRPAGKIENKAIEAEKAGPDKPAAEEAKTAAKPPAEATPPDAEQQKASPPAAETEAKAPDTGQDAPGPTDSAAAKTAAGDGKETREQQANAPRAVGPRGTVPFNPDENTLSDTEMPPAQTYE